MALDAGTVSIDSDGVAIGDGLAMALAEAKLAAFELPENAGAKAVVVAGIAADCNATAEAIVAYFIANAEPIVDGQTGALT